MLKIDQGASANELSVVSTASAHLTTIDVVGCFGALPTPPAQATPTLGCTNVNSAAATVSPGGGSVCAVAACAAGYVVTGEELVVAPIRTTIPSVRPRFTPVQRLATAGRFATLAPPP